MEPPKKKIKGNTPTTTTSINPTILSDDVIDTIFSLVPIKSAVEFSATSKRHISSWTLNQNLDFGNSIGKHSLQHNNYIAIIDRVLSFHIGPKVRSFRLYFDPITKIPKLEEWIIFAASKGVEELDLDFTVGKQLFEFPYYLFNNCLALSSLKLCTCTLRFNESFTGLGSLTSLLLKNVDITEEQIRIALRNCLSLEVLDLKKCRKLYILKVHAHHQKSFKKLKVTKCTDLLSFEIDAPSLLSLHYCGAVQNITSFGNVSKLKDVILSFKKLKAFMGSILHLQRIDTLTINSTFLEGLRRAPIYLPGLKEFQLVMEGASYCNPYDVALFLSNCPFLEGVFIDLDDFSFNCGPYWEYIDKAPFEEFSYIFHRLRSVKVKGFKLEVNEIKLIKFFLEKADVLETLAMITPTKRSLKVSVKEVQNHIPTFITWRRSQRARVLVFPYSNDRSCLQPTHSALRRLNRGN